MNRIRIESDGTPLGTKIYGPSGASITAKEINIGHIKARPKEMPSAIITAYIEREPWTPFARKESGGVHVVEGGPASLMLRDCNGQEIPFVWLRTHKIDAQHDALVTFKVELHHNEPMSASVHHGGVAVQRAVQDAIASEERPGGMLYRGPECDYKGPQPKEPQRFTVTHHGRHAWLFYGDELICTFDRRNGPRNPDGRDA